MINLFNPIVPNAFGTQMSYLELLRVMQNEINKELNNLNNLINTIDVKFTGITDQLKEDVETVDGKVETLDGRVTEEVEKLNALIQATEEALTADIQKVAQDLITVKESIENEIDRINTELTQIQSEQVAQNERLTDIETEQSDQNERLDNVENKNTEQDGRLTALENEDKKQNDQLTSIEGYVQKNAQDITTLNNDIADLENDVRENADDIVSLNNDIATVNGDLSGVHDSIAKNAQDISALNNDVSAINTDMASIRDDVNKNATDISANYDDIQAIQQDVTQLEGSVQQNTTDIANHYAEMQGRLSGLQAQASSNSTDISQIKNNDLPLIAQEQEEQNGKITDNTTDIDDLKTRVSSIEASGGGGEPVDLSDYVKNDVFESGQERQDNKISVIELGLDDLKTSVLGFENKFVPIDADMNNNSLINTNIYVQDPSINSVTKRPVTSVFQYINDSIDEHDITTNDSFVLFQNQNLVKTPIYNYENEDTAKIITFQNDGIALATPYEILNSVEVQGEEADIDDNPAFQVLGDNPYGNYLRTNDVSKWNFTKISTTVPDNAVSGKKDIVFTARYNDPSSVGGSTVQSIFAKGLLDTTPQPEIGINSVIPATNNDRTEVYSVIPKDVVIAGANNMRNIQFVNSNDVISKSLYMLNTEEWVTASPAKATFDSLANAPIINTVGDLDTSFVYLLVQNTVCKMPLLTFRNIMNTPSV